jgi:hypothetical protein
MVVTGATHDTWVLVKTSKFARVCPTLLPESREQAPHREITDMARHTKTKIAALAFSFVAALGVVAAGPITTADAGHATKISAKETCC